MSFGEPWGYPFYSGGGTSALIPDRYDFGIAGRPYLIDQKINPQRGITKAHIPVQRPQADTGANPGEGTLSSDVYWRRTSESWHLGSGQRYYDRHEGNPFRYDTSTGVDPWERYELTLLPDTTRSLTSTGTEIHLAVAGGRLYASDGQVVRYTTDLVNWTAITGNPAQTALSLASDGSTLYVAYGPSGVYTVAAGAAAMTSFATGTAATVGYAKGRLLVVETSGASPRVYNVTATGTITAGTLLLTVPGASFPTGQWTAEGPSCLYLIAAVGDQTRIWRTAVKADGTALDAPIIAGQIPEGQVGKSIAGFLGSLMFLGTQDKVWVLSVADDAGNLAIRGHVNADSAVLALEGQERFVWYGADDALLGRIDTGTNVADDGSYTPAHATDLKASLSGAVRSIATFADRRVFAVSGRGVYVEDTTGTVDSGTLSLGIIGWGLGDLKNALYLDVRHHPLATGDSVTVEVRADNGNWNIAGVSSVVGTVSAAIPLGQLLAETVELRITLAGNPTVTMLTARAIPAPPLGVVWQVDLRLFDRDEDLNNQPTDFMDPTVELAYIEALAESRTAVPIQIGGTTFTGVIDRLVAWTAESKAYDDQNKWTGRWNGSARLLINEVTSA